MKQGLLSSVKLVLFIVCALLLWGVDAGAKSPAIRFPVNTEGSPATGNPKAAVTIVEFTDFECPFCGTVQPTIQEILDRYSGQVRLVFKNYPLSFHRNARRAHLAAMCAEEQGKFWPYRYHLFQNQKALKKEALLRYADQFGMDLGLFERCLEQEKYGAKLLEDYQQGLHLGVRGTPMFFINGRPLSGAHPFEAFEAIINEELGQMASSDLLE